MEGAPLSHRSIRIALGAWACLAIASRPAQAFPLRIPMTTAPEVAGSSVARLEAADAALDAGQLDRAAQLYELIARETPGSPEAVQARRALKILTITRAPSPALAYPPRAPEPAAASAVPPSAPSLPATSLGPVPPVANAAPPPTAPPANGEVVMRREPYSLRTAERLRLTTWEKLDFGTTSFLYGLSVGFSYGLSLSPNDGGDAAAPAVLGAVLYTAGAVAFLSTTNPDRGDLPLALAITSYAPTTTLLLSSIVFDHPDSEHVAFAVATTGLLSVPVAILAARHFDLDPGDTQLVRDAGFWGLVLATTGTLAWGGSTGDYGNGYTYHRDPSSRRVAVAGAVGLYGGLGLGILAAANSEVSLERVRVATWGGYGGALLGLILGASGRGSNDRDVWSGVTIGGAAGLILTFVTTSVLDGIPAETTTVARASRGALAPAIVPVTDASGRRSTATWGIAGTL